MPKPKFDDKFPDIRDTHRVFSLMDRLGYDLIDGIQMEKGEKGIDKQGNEYRNHYAHMEFKNRNGKNDSERIRRILEKNLGESLWTFDHGRHEGTVSIRVD